MGPVREMHLVVSMVRGIALLLVLVLMAASCAGSATDTTSVTGPTPPTTVSPTNDAELARADVPRAVRTDVTSSELDVLVDGDTALAFDLFRIARDDGNTLLSPSSISAALTMTLAGARGGTAAEMREVLHINMTDDRIHTARNELDLQLASPPEKLPGDERQPLTISVANSLWGQSDYPFRDEFLKLLAEHYGAGMNLADFNTAPEEARRAINSWVEDETNDRIVDLIPEGVITTLTRLVLVNAIWFRANWADQFDPEATEDGSFDLLDGEEATVPLMHGGGRMDFIETDEYRAVRLPYAGDASMLIVLPDKNRFDQVAAAFGPDDLATIDRDASVHQVALTMPKFEFMSEFALKASLKELGMGTAFTSPSLTGGADFTGMTEARELFIHEVVHQAFISVDEQGTEAAAATAVVVGLESAPPPAEVILNRPFFFLIQHGSTGEVLFIGQVVDPR